MKIALEAPKIDLGASGHALLKAYLCLLLVGGHVGLPLALITIFASKSVNKKYPTLINMLVSWILYSTGALLLFYSGEYQSRQPDFNLCLAQASLMYGSTVMVGVATLCLVIQLWIELYGRYTTSLSLRTRVLLVVFPWVIVALTVSFVAIYGSIHKSRVSYRWMFYCTISSNAVVNTIVGLTMASLITIFGFEVSILRKLYKASRQIRAVNRASYNMVVRVSVFVGYTLITFIIFGVNVIIPDLIFPYIFLATLPLTAFAIFGANRDNVDVWTRCFKSFPRRRHRDDDNRANRLEPIMFGNNRHDATDFSQSVSRTIDSDKAVGRPTLDATLGF